MQKGNHHREIKYHQVRHCFARENVTCAHQQYCIHYPALAVRTGHLPLCLESRWVGTLGKYLNVKNLVCVVGTGVICASYHAP